MGQGIQKWTAYKRQLLKNFAWPIFEYLDINIADFPDFQEFCVSLIRREGPQESSSYLIN